jgi:thioredoxin-like negative regulator of GroEL
MKESRRDNLLLAFSILLIVGTAGIYAALIRQWLGGGSTAAPLQKEKRVDPEELMSARLEFRARFADPASALRLSEALFRAGRPVDAFYVAAEARALYPAASFTQAHDSVVLKKSDFHGGRPFDPSPANEKALRDRLSGEPENPALYRYLAQIALDRAQVQEAMRWTDQGLAARSDDRGLLYLKAQLLAASNPIDSIGIRARLVNAKPDVWEARASLEQLGRLAQQRDDGPSGESARMAREALEELLKEHPDHPQIFSTLAMAAWQRGELDSVRAMAASTLSKRPKHAGALMVEAAIALYDNLPDKALRLFNEAWEKNPDDVYSAGKLAQIYYRQRADAESALPFLIALYRHNPDYEDGGESAEKIVRSILDARRAALLQRATIESLGIHLRSEDASLRAEACARAATFADQRWLETLFDLMDDDTEIVRHNADYALFTLAKSFPDSIRVRRDDWLASKKPLQRARVLNLLADLYPAETLPLVAEALHDSSQAVRYYARTLALAHYGEDVAAAEKLRAEYVKAERDPFVIALYK